MPLIMSYLTLPSANFHQRPPPEPAAEVGVVERPAAEVGEFLQ